MDKPGVGRHKKRVGKRQKPITEERLCEVRKDWRGLGFKTPTLMETSIGKNEKNDDLVIK
jgi:hypothetical protein